MRGKPCYISLTVPVAVLVGVATLFFPQEYRSVLPSVTPGLATILTSPSRLNFMKVIPVAVTGDDDDDDDELTGTIYHNNI